jgi:AMMECR1 domain-containing protein
MLLPADAVDHKWDKEGFLDALCEAAKLEPGTWRRPDVSIYKFTTQAFKESSPEGEVREVHLE